MKALEFDSAQVPLAERLAAFRRASADFRVTPRGASNDFHIRWRLLTLGDLNLIRSTATPLHYRRDRSMIDADGQDRITIHCYVKGRATGMLDGRPIEVDAGMATVWDLTRTLDIQSLTATEIIIITMPRYLLDEIFAVPSYSCVMPASSTLALAIDQVAHMVARPDDLADASATHVGRAVRDLFALALLPILQRKDASDAEEPLFHRLCHAIDAHLARDLDAAGCADLLGSSSDAVLGAADQAGGLAKLVERRRLLAGYRMLSNPDDTAPISVVAWRCGFTDVPRFNRRFRAVFGARPRDVRTQFNGLLPAWAGAYRVEAEYRQFLADGNG